MAKSTDDKKYNPNPISETTKKMVCWYTHDGESIEQIAKDTQRPPQQIKKILRECKKSGFYDLAIDLKENFRTSVPEDKKATYSIIEKKYRGIVGYTDV